MTDIIKFENDNNINNLILYHGQQNKLIFMGLVWKAIRNEEHYYNIDEKYRTYLFKIFEEFKKETGESSQLVIYALPHNIKDKYYYNAKEMGICINNDNINANINANTANSSEDRKFRSLY